MMFGRYTRIFNAGGSSWCIRAGGVHGLAYAYVRLFMVVVNVDDRWIVCEANACTQTNQV